MCGGDGCVIFVRCVGIGDGVVSNYFIIVGLTGSRFDYVVLGLSYRASLLGLNVMAGPQPYTKSERISLKNTSLSVEPTV